MTTAIRPAIISDLAAVTLVRTTLALNTEKLRDDQYRARIQSQGFLLPGLLTHEEFRQDLHKYLLYEIDGNVVGYTLIDDKQELDSEMETFWEKDELKDQYFAQPHASLRGVGVLPEAGRHGIAAAMLDSAENRLRDHGSLYLFSFIIVSPVTNTPSIMFHEKNGFEKWATIKPCTLFGMDNYQSLLYAKQLKNISQ